jgi:hypothetical protein
MERPATVYTIGDFVRRVVESLLRGDWRGRVLCSQCLLKLTRDHLDKSYAKADVVREMDEIFTTPGPIAPAVTATCARCSRKKPCLGLPLP